MALEGGMKCKTHLQTDMVIGDCYRCGGNGFTDSDLDDMDNPLEWHNSGQCYACKGAGKGFLECPVCEEDYRMEQELEDDAN